MDTSMDQKNKGKVACATAGGSLGLAALAGACSSGCGLIAAPLAGLLTSAGFGAAATILPKFQLPLFLIALVLGIYSIRIFAKQKNTIGIVATSVVLGAGAVFMAWQIFSAGQCSSRVDSVLSRLSPHARLVFQKGVYPLWPELGRAPTIQEVREKLALASDDDVLSAFRELEKMGYQNVFYPGTTNIKWLWPFSSLDHGVEVTLDNSKPVHARCAIDALGMSEMFGKSARISIKSALDDKPIEFQVNGTKIDKANSDVVVSYSNSCDDILFFSSRDEYERYVKQSGKNYLQVMSLQQALEKGLETFGRILKS
jgi:hypothetical protein